MRFIIVLDVDGELPAEPASRIHELLTLWCAVPCASRVWAVEFPNVGAHCAEMILERLEKTWGDKAPVRAMVIPAANPSATFRMVDSRAASLLESP